MSPSLGCGLARDSMRLESEEERMVTYLYTHSQKRGEVCFANTRSCMPQASITSPPPPPPTARSTATACPQLPRLRRLRLVPIFREPCQLINSEHAIGASLCCLCATQEGGDIEDVITQHAVRVLQVCSLSLALEVDDAVTYGKYIVVTCNLATPTYRTDLNQLN